MKTSDPVRAAQDSEFRTALREAEKQLTRTEKAALQRVSESAEDSMRDVRVEKSTPYVQEHRCRQRLQQLLSRFDPRD